jgi:GNAT superfamily N-acetyltransferase
MHIRKATVDDAPAVCDVLRRSIAELCTADHRNDPEILGAWLRTKTPDNIAMWIRRADSTMFVAEECGRILAAASVVDTGETNVNYVAPEARFRGVSKALMAVLEQHAIECDNGVCVLLSTGTARRFYQSLGYVESGAPIKRFGTDGFPMRKELVVWV